ncbi:splicing factor, suppressor of white-apricot homolog isoform X2 [Chiloscyllium plagiosum]|uniref:splicing factor, suppressor of white-apricot homolog isoform X2 n=1 Tax=Chiloscyllium plagiosum TaxID=36176 RepID=UPI001CB86B0D|nr:splicing factor, suppressor of white-apricot homolog isoform X2 [Chiloscyllium plagiosum]
MAQARAYTFPNHRKKQQNNNNKKKEDDKKKVVELLVFGYACKLFREDDKAQFHEQGKHLIPWMGDPALLIDRYDCRGHLNDLSECDAEYTWNRDYQLSEEEARIDALCDEERYLALHTDLLEEEARQEEEYRRLNEALAEDGIYNAVGFAYSSDYYDPSQPTEEEELAKTDGEIDDNAEENEEPYTAPPGLLVPSDVEVPATSKMHAIIERTAKFVCKQGTQFEIMLKAKQARNSQFDFLRFDHYLNPYYKHILKTMKDGKYVVQAEKRGEEKKKSVTESGDDDDDDNDGCYLHPSLFASKSNSRLEELTRPLKVMDPDHPLAALVRKVQADAKNVQKQQESNNSEAAAATVEYTAADSVTTMYYGYYMMPDGTYCLTPPPPGMEVSGYYSTLSSEMAVPTTTGASVSTSSGTASPPHSEGDSTNTKASSSTVTVSAPTVVPVIIPPPPDIQPVIDKLAEYVARNGTKFETSVRDKNDTRFEFLQPWHQYNAYYEFKKQYFSQKEGCSIPQETAASSTLVCSESNTTDVLQFEAQQEVTDTSISSVMMTQTDCTLSTDKAISDGKLIKASFAPICFAIKAKENDMLPLEKKRVKLDDDSDEDHDVQEASNMESTKDIASSLPPEEKKPQLTAEEIEAKQAKQKLEDRLAAAAREKLAQASKECKERQLQAERKKRAALFLQNLKTPTTSGDLEAITMEESSQSMQIDNSEVFSAKFHQRLITKISPEVGGRSAHLAHPAIETYRPSNATSNCLLNDSASTTLPRRSIQVANEISQKIAAAAEANTSQQISTKSVRSSKDREKKKEKKHRKKSRSRSRSRPRYRLRSRSRSTSRSRSRSRSKAKHSLPSAYRSVRHSRSRSPHGRRVQASERRRDERERDRNVPSAYRVGNSSDISSRKRSRSPYEKKKKKSSKSHPKLKEKSLRSRSRSLSPKKSSVKSSARSSAHSNSLSPAESRGSSQDQSRENLERKTENLETDFRRLDGRPRRRQEYQPVQHQTCHEITSFEEWRRPYQRGGSQEKDETASPELLSSMQSKITQDLMAKVREMLASSKDVQSNVS